MSEKKQADVQELVQELSHCNDVQSLQETAHSMGKDLSEEDSRGLFDLLGTAASNQVFSSLVSGNQASSGLNLGTLLNFASGQTQQAQVQQNPLADGFQLTDLITFMQGSNTQQSSGLNASNLLSGLLGGGSQQQSGGLSTKQLMALLPILVKIVKILK
jgi:mannose/fructose-specific phosphotransferase system component IIA